jgi:hypothetical protein
MLNLLGRLNGRAIRGRRWRVTLRSAPLFGFLLFGKWDAKVRIFRWKWLAEADARRHKLMAGKDVLTDTHVEPYVAGTNIVPLPSCRIRARAPQGYRCPRSSRCRAQRPSVGLP